MVDPEIYARTDAIDQGIEHGLATAEATDQADVAYSHQEQYAAVEASSTTDDANNIFATNTPPDIHSHTRDAEVQQVCLSLEAKFHVHFAA